MRLGIQASLARRVATAAHDDISIIHTRGKELYFLAEDRPQRAPSPSGLDQRLLEVLRLLAAGETTKTISAKLSYSERTIKTLIRQAEFELGARSRAQAVAEAIRRGLI